MPSAALGTESMTELFRVVKGPGRWRDTMCQSQQLKGTIGSSANKHCSKIDSCSSSEYYQT